MDDQEQSLSHIAEGLRQFAIPIDSLILDPANAKKHPERSIEAIKGSIARFRQQKPIVYDPVTRVVRAGNGTWEAMKALGHSMIAAVPTDLQGSELTAYAIADNRSAEHSLWDFDSLTDQLQSLRDEGFNLDLDLGWSEQECAALFSAMRAEVPPGPVSTGDPEPDVDANTGTSEEKQKDKPPSGKSVFFTDEQYQVILQAVIRVQAECGEPRPSIAKSIELIAADYLAGPDTDPAGDEDGRDEPTESVSD